MTLRNVSSFFVLFALLLPFAPIAHAAPMPYPDMEHSWWGYRTAVSELAQRKVIQGHPDGTFKPDLPINRAEFLKIVFKGHSTVAPTRRCFPDVNPDKWYAPYVCTAARRGIIKGYPDGYFHPDSSVNWAEAIKMMLNAYGREIQEGGGEQWYLPYVEELESKDILSGSSFLPWENITRERAADLIWRALQNQEDRTIPRWSAGCGKSPLPLPLFVTVNGEERQFLLTVPEGYQPHDHLGLIVAFHGRTNGNEEVRAYFGLDKHAGDFLVAYPAALKNGGGSFSWANGGDAPDRLSDLAFFDALTELLAENYCIDLDRIFVTGHSLGAWFANSLACVRGDVIRGSATVGGSSVFTDCAGPSAAMLIHNPRDNLASFSETEKTRTQRMEENFCTAETEPAEPQTLNCVVHEGCYGGNELLWCPHTINEFNGSHYPHQWPRGTGEYVLNFFRSLR